MSDYFYSFSCACMRYISRDNVSLVVDVMGHLDELKDEENQ